MKQYLYRIRFVVAVIVAIVLPILVTGGVLLDIAEQALLAEKREKLIAITHQLDYALPDDFDALLAKAGAQGASRAEKISLLSQQLTPVTDRIAAAHPGVGVGYYAAELDAILTYGPSGEMGHHVGSPIAADHPGRAVMRTGKADVVVGEQVRGNIMNAMTPLIRDGKVIGYAWANELMASIDVQLARMRQGILAILGIGCMIAAALSGLVVHRLEVILAEIKHGLQELSRNLSYRFKRIPGEPGEITEAINKLARDLQASRTHTENIIQSMDNGVIALDREGLVTAWNQAATVMTGIAPERAVGAPIQDLLGEDSRLAAILLAPLHNGQTCKDYELAHPVNGSTVILKVTTSLLRNPQHDLLGVIMVLEDRTIFKQMETSLAQARRLAMIGELSAGIAHEVRNPLTSIKAFTQILEEELPQDHDGREYTRIIIEEVDRLNRFADELLMFSRPQEERNVPVDIHKVLEQTLLLVKRQAAQQGISLEKPDAPEPAQIQASPELLKQVFLNILLNAVQATQSGGWIKVTSERVDGFLLIHIDNQGSPIAEEILPRIFEPFFTTKAAGSGLGLSISQRIVQAYGGQIEVQNLAEGVRFTVRLPLTARGQTDHAADPDR
ncbi:two-component system sensor histidine kinase AtoS [Brevibacillus marinus]|uniref:two-component system sensor histidine kinase AtoS n=1 Tax=Brevibacillus marinus TaxID=2496837 RepID=UPI000F837A63|nr:two-component system sensor histidine kinase AtoS [Brevibacillus marinus]